MSASTQKMTMRQFVECLEALDDELDGVNPGKKLELDCVGGFAMLAHGLRTPAVTGDIDVVACDFDEDVQTAIRNVADSFGIDDDWINNHTVLARDGEVTQDDVDAFNGQIEARYEPLPASEHLRNISVNVVDLDALAKAKGYAVCAIDLGARSKRDLDDLIDIFDAQGLYDAESRKRHHTWLTYPEFADCANKLGIVGNSPKEYQDARFDSLGAEYGIENLDTIDEFNPYDDFY